MIRKALWMVLMMILIGSVLSACSTSVAGSSFHDKTPAVTSTSTPEQPLEKLFASPGWHSVAQAKNVNEASAITEITLIKLPVQRHIILLAQCRGAGHFAMSIKSHVDLPLSCQTARPSELVYENGKPSKNEQYEVSLHIEGSVEWQAMVELPNS